MAVWIGFYGGILSFWWYSILYSLYFLITSICSLFYNS